MKIHIWNFTKTFPGKVNFIDSNNVILGYDLSQDCCEDAFWTISEREDGEEPMHRGEGYKQQEFELDDYCFDPDYYKDASDDAASTYVAMFKLKGSCERPDLFLRLTNIQSGYYGHGFTFRGSKTIEGVL